MKMLKKILTISLFLLIILSNFYFLVFKGKIEFVDTKVVRKNNYWVLDVNKYHILSK